MGDEVKAEKKGILVFDEGLKPFVLYHKGISHFTELAVEVYLDEENIGYITSEGNVTIRGTVTEREPARIMSYANTLTLKQWSEIGARAEELILKCAERMAEFGPVFKKLEDLASKKFPEDAPFGHMEIARKRSIHLVIAGGKGEWSTYPPGIYTYDDSPYGGEAVKLGYRPVEEQRVKGVNNLDDVMLAELIKTASSMDAPEG